MPPRYAVIGNPIAHSRSPEIHQMFARQLGIAIEYERVLAPLDGFAATLQALQAQGYHGANVTVPFKLQAYDLAQRSQRASEAGAVNTLSFKDGTIFGDNTDGVGLVRDIVHNLSTPILGKRVLLLGAGGAAQGVLHPLLEQSPAVVVIANRTLKKAQAMVDSVRSRKADQRINQSIESRQAAELLASTFAGLQGHTFDIAINATSAGLSDDRLPLPDGLLADGALAYDMMYGRETPFMAYARSMQAVVANGLGMLVEQAAEAFYLWHQRRPHTAPVMHALRTPAA